MSESHQGQHISPLRSVWIVARPYFFFPPLNLPHFAFYHWGVLVTELTVIDVQSLLCPLESIPELEDSVLGTLFEGDLTAERRLKLVCTHAFKLSTFNTKWKDPLIYHVGMTGLSDNEIYNEGKNTLHGAD
jgi:hypothetical protein